MYYACSQCVDSFYSSIVIPLEKIVLKLFTKYDKPVIKVYVYQKQKGGSDCGLFAIASATAIAFGFDQI